LQGGGLEVHLVEPRPEVDRFYALANVILTPHNAAGSRFALLDEIAMQFDNARAMLAGAALARPRSLTLFDGDARRPADVDRQHRAGDVLPSRTSEEHDHRADRPRFHEAADGLAAGEEAAGRVLPREPLFAHHTLDARVAIGRQYRAWTHGIAGDAILQPLQRDDARLAKFIAVYVVR